MQSIGEFILTDRNMRIKPRGKIYSINEGYEKYWFDPVKDYVNKKKHPQVLHNFILHLLHCSFSLRNSVALGSLSVLWITLYCPLMCSHIPSLKGRAYRE